MLDFDVKNNDVDKWLINVNSMLVKKNQRINKKYVVAKLKLIHNMFGIGLPTTRGYSAIYGRNKQLQYIYGRYVQMFFSVKIDTNMIHHSFSWCFPHATAVPIAMSKTDIY